ncbi:MAG: M20/M25/M40 family metallo-hydrolase [Bacteroidota bacterium]
MRYGFFMVLSLLATSLAAQTEQEVITNFKKDISYLASDMLQGRLTGSSGELKSSLYIADEFKTYGILPYGDSNTYFQSFKIVRLRLSKNRNPMIFKQERGLMSALDALKGEYYPLSPSCNRDSMVAPVFQAGYGIQAKELSHDDYKDTAGIRGKIFVIKLGHPDVENPHSKFDSYGSITYKVETAYKMGARAVVFVRVDTITPIPSGRIDRSVKAGHIPVVYAAIKGDEILKALEIYVSVNIAQIEADAHNVIGFINNKKKKTIVIGAHQDHLGYNEFGGSRSTDEGKIHNGADDNASGVAMMMQLMRKIKKSKKLRKNNYLFIAFSGEEQGLLGSNYFVNHPTIPVGTVKYMLNFDMVGRLDSTKKVLMVYGVGTSPEWNKGLAKVKTDSTQIKIKTTESGTGSSDHTSFYFQKIPVLHYFTGQHKDYHMPSDDENLINYTGMYYCYDVVLQMIKAVNKTKSFVYTPTKQEESVRMSFKVTLGIMPDYIFDGIGLRVDGVNMDKPGEKAGLLKGDIIVKLGDTVINNINDYMKALSNFKHGDKSTIVIMRGTEQKTLEVVF